MDNNILLIELEKLVPKNGFDSQDAAIEWTTKVTSLLKIVPNKDYYETFRFYAQYFCLNLSANLQTTAYNIMKSQLNTAIAELKFNAAEELEMQGKYFRANSYLDIQKFVSKIIGRAHKELWICDGYLDQLIIEDLTLAKADEIKILTYDPSELFKKRLAAAKKQFSNKLIEARLNSKIHDRYFILDKNEVWSIGTSYNEKAGNKPTNLMKIKDDTTNIINDYMEMWNNSEVLK